MTGKNIIIGGIITAIVGTLMTIYRNTLTAENIAAIAGIVFICSAALHLLIINIQNSRSRDKNGKAANGAIATYLSWIVCPVAAVAGLIMLFFNKHFAEYIAFMYGLIILIASVFQLLLLLFNSKPSLSKLFFIVPVIMVGVAVFVLMSKPGIEIQFYTALTGVSLMLFGVSSIIEGITIIVSRHRTDDTNAEQQTIKREIESDESNNDV